jgi:hypothetical protein
LSALEPRGGIKIYPGFFFFLEFYSIDLVIWLKCLKDFSTFFILLLLLFVCILEDWIEWFISYFIILYILVIRNVLQCLIVRLVDLCVGLGCVYIVSCIPIGYCLYACMCVRPFILNVYCYVCCTFSIGCYYQCMHTNYVSSFQLCFFAGVCLLNFLLMFQNKFLMLNSIFLNTFYNEI